MKTNVFQLKNLGLFFFALLLASCAKKADQIANEQEGFLRLFGDSAQAGLNNASENLDGSLLFGGVYLDDFKPFVIHTDKHGNFIDKKTVNISPNENFLARTTKLKSGQVVFTSLLSPRLMRFDQHGEILVDKRYTLAILSALYALPLEEEDGNLLIGFSQPNLGGIYSGVFRTDQNGVLQTTILLDLVTRKKTIFSLAVAKSNNGKMILVGDCKPLYYKYSDKNKIFVAEYDESLKQLSKFQIFDETDNSEYDLMTGVVATKEGFVVLSNSTLIGQLPSSIPNPEFELFFFDDDLKLVKRKRYDLGVVDIIANSIIATKDGGFIVSGYSTSITSRDYKGFIAKINADGALAYSRIFPYLEHMELYGGQETMDGHLLFSGGSLSFGNGNERMTSFILKVDKDGSLN